MASKPVQIAAEAPGGSVGATDLPAGLVCILTRESQRRYTAVSPYGDKGAGQYKDSTWDGYGGYARADLAPPAVQDARALQDYNRGPAARHQLWPNTSRACGVEFVIRTIIVI